MAITSTVRRLKKTVQDVLGAITIEPMLFTRNVAMYSTFIVSENLKLDRFCRIKLGYSEEICANLNDGHHDDEQVEVQKQDNLFNFYQNVVGMVVPVILISFIASWSDRSGRKIPLLMSLLGYILHTGIYLLMSFFPSWPPEVLYAAAFLKTIGGGWVLFYMAAYSYIADNSVAKSRTFRMAAMNVIWSFGGPVGTAVGTLIYDKAGYSSLFGFSFTLYILCFIYCIIIVKNKVQTTEANQESPEKRSPFNIKNVLDLFKTCFAKRPGRGRLHVMLLMSIMMAAYSSDLHNLYLWSMRVFYWNTDSYTLYKTVNDITQTFAMLIATSLLPIFRLHDCIVGGATALGKFTQLLTLGLLTKESQGWVPYLFIVIPGGLCGITIRSMISKIVNEDEVGRVFSLLSILEVFWPIVDSAIFTGVYDATIDFYPSYEHLIASMFTLYMFSGFLGLKHSIDNQEIREMEKSLDHPEERKSVPCGHSRGSVRASPGV